MRLALEREGFAVSIHPDAPSGVRPPVSLIIVSSSKRAHAATLCRSLRDDPRTHNLPIVVLADAPGEEEALCAFAAGADDVVAPPWRTRIIVARVRAILRRARLETELRLPGTPQRIGPLTIDAERHQAFVRGGTLALTLAEYRLLAALATRPGHVFSREQLLEAIAGGETDVTDRNIDAHVKMIRKKLGADRDFIQTVRGVGYKCRDR